MNLKILHFRKNKSIRYCFEVFCRFFSKLKEFTSKFEKQYPAFKWDNFSMVKEVFQGDCQLTPPCGINPQSNTIIFSDGSSQNLSGSLFKIQFLFFSTF